MVQIRRSPKWHLSIMIAAVAVAALVGAGGGWLWSSARTPVFAASAVLQVRGSSPSEAEVESLRAEARIAPALAAIAVSPSRVVAAANRIGLTTELPELLESVSARNQPGTPFITITAWLDQPATAAALANDLALNAASGGRAAAMPDRARLQLVEPAAVPNRQAYTRPGRDMATGAFAAAMLMIGVLVYRRREPEPVAQRSPTKWREISAGVALAIAIVLVSAVGAPDIVGQGLAVAAAAMAVASPSAALALLAVVLPLPESTRFGPIGVNLVVIGGLAYGTVLRIVIDRDPPHLSVGAVAVAAFIGLAVIGSIPALNGTYGDAATSAIASVLQLGAGLALVLCTAYHLAREDPRPYLGLVVVSAAFASGLAVVQLLTGDPGAGLLSGLVAPADIINPARPSGPFQNANYFGLFVALGLIASLGAWLIIPRLRIVTVAALAILAVALTVGALSRGAVLALLAGLVVLIWSLARPRLAVAATGALLLIAVVAIPLAVDARLSRSTTGTAAQAIAGVSESDLERLSAVLAAFPLFSIDPLFGVGFGQYGTASPRFLASSPVTASHSQYLDSLAEQGVVGVAALAALLGTTVISLLRSGAHLPKVGAAMLVTYLVGSLFLEPLASLQTSGLLWLMLGAGIAVARTAPDSGTVEADGRPVARATWPVDSPA